MNDPRNFVDPSGQDLWDFIPFASGARNIYQGIKCGNGWQVLEGFAEIALDATTAGSGSIIKGTVKTAAKAVGRRVLKEVAEEGAEQGSKQAVRAAKTSTTKTAKHHIATNKHMTKWTPKFKKLFEKCGMSLNDTDNLLELIDDIHRKRAPHSEGYHEWVHRELLRAVQGAKDQKECQKKLRSKLKELGEIIKTNPDVLRKCK